MTGFFKAACIQMRTGVEVGPNLDAACELITEAKAQGADFVLTPENTSTISLLKSDQICGEAVHPGASRFRRLAEELGIWLLIGSMGVEISPGRFANRSFLFDPRGAKIAHYDKIHMFDVNVSETETWMESKTYQAGSQAVVAQTPWGGLGMTICYDMRFPHLYRELARAGAQMISVPSAFTVPTGKAHWHTLLRARAIECGAYVFAPAQGGTHENGRETYGHSLIIDPWGQVIAEAGSEPEILLCDIDLEAIREARRRLPTLSHDRPFEVTHFGGAIAE
jgi:predicted amidohydrolase